MTRVLHKNLFGRIFICVLSFIFLAAASLPLTSCNENISEESSTPPSIESSGDDVPVVVPPKKRVALTFDDGPQYYNDQETKSIVDELSKYGFHATFFVVGNRIPGGDALKYAVDKGNEVGIHGYTHSVYYDTCTDADYADEIERTAAAIKKQIPDYEIKLMRPVGGRITDERAAASPYSIIMWTVDSDDWKHKYSSGDSDQVCAEKVNAIVENVMSKVADGDIILMHDIYQSTYDAAVIIIQRLHEAGYEIVTVSELLGNTMTPGRIYYGLYE